MTTSDPVMDAQRYYDKQGQADALREKAEIALATEFITACHKCDAGAIAEFAGLTTDWSKTGGKPFVFGATRPMRSQQLYEAMADSLDIGPGPTTSELYQLVLNAAFGDIASVQAQARRLLSNMASNYAHNNVGEVCA